MRIFKRLAWAVAALCLLVGGFCLLQSSRYRLPFTPPIGPLSRPYGMAPAAFDGFKRACYRAHVNPRRIGQTIGDNPLSVGYHKRDGTLNYRGQKLDYTAVVDLGTWDLTRPQINVLLEELARQGFAAFYREKGKWRGREHIHAIYAPLKMKPQLQEQIRGWTRGRQHQPVYSWQRKYARNWR